MCARRAGLQRQLPEVGAGARVSAARCSVPRDKWRQHVAECGVVLSWRGELLRAVGQGCGEGAGADGEAEYEDDGGD